MSYEIKCTKCNSILTHDCNADVKKALLRLLTWVPEGGASAHLHLKELLKQIEPDIEEAPFFGSQAWSYTLFHKEEARTFHALINNLIRALGYEPYALAREAMEFEDDY